MSKVRQFVVTFVAVLSVGALGSAVASAAQAEWMLNGRALAEEGLTSAALRTTASTDTPDIFSFSGLTYECVGQLEGKKPEIVKSTIAKAESLILTRCLATSPAACSFPTTIGTVPIEGEVTLDGSLAVKAIVHPQSGRVFTTLVITGAECAVEGSKPLTGDFEVLAPEGQDERTDQLLDFKQGSTGLLKLGSESTSLSGSASLLLVNGAAWSFL